MKHILQQNRTVLSNRFAFAVFLLSSASAAGAQTSIDSPRGGEVYVAGQVQEIRIGGRALKEIDIELSRDAGGTFEKIGTIVNASLPRNERNRLRWTVNGPPSTACQFRATIGNTSITSGMFSISEENAISAPLSAGLNKVDRSGDSMSGPLTLSGNPEGPFHAATKEYVDQHVAGGQFWRLNGNTGTSAGASFLGTIDGQALELKVHNQRALRLEPHADSPNIVAGFSGNAVGTGIFGATIGGGGLSTLDSPGHLIKGSFGTIAGGCNNQAGDDTDVIEGNACATVGGGRNNRSALFGDTVAGGDHNVAEGVWASVLGGTENRAGSTGATIGGGMKNSAGYFAAIPGGMNNQASGLVAAIGGGEENQAAGRAATVPGGSGNEAAGDCALAAGCYARAARSGQFVWADNHPLYFPAGDETLFNTGENAFLARATGGVAFVTAIDSCGHAAAGVRLAPGCGAWTVLSDRSAKSEFQRVDGREILRRLAALPIQTWSYRAQAEGVRHMGPMAQDFYNAFGLGDDCRGICTIDSDGVAFAAIQGLQQELAEKSAELESLRKSSAEMAARLQRLEEQVRASAKP